MDADGREEHTKGRQSEQAAPSRKRQDTTSSTQGSQPVDLSMTGTTAAPVSQTETIPAKVKSGRIRRKARMASKILASTSTRSRVPLRPRGTRNQELQRHTSCCAAEKDSGGTTHPAPSAPNGTTAASTPSTSQTMPPATEQYMICRKRIIPIERGRTLL